MPVLKDRISQFSCSFVSRVALVTLIAASVAVLVFLLIGNNNITSFNNNNVNGTSSIDYHAEEFNNGTLVEAPSTQALTTAPYSPSTSNLRGTTTTLAPTTTTLGWFKSIDDKHSNSIYELNM